MSDTKSSTYFAVVLGEPNSMKKNFALSVPSIANPKNAEEKINNKQYRNTKRIEPWAYDKALHKLRNEIEYLGDSSDLDV